MPSLYIYCARLPVDSIVFPPPCFYIVFRKVSRDENTVIKKHTLFKLWNTEGVLSRRHSLHAWHSVHTAPKVGQRSACLQCLHTCVSALWKGKSIYSWSYWKGDEHSRWGHNTTQRYSSVSQRGSLIDHWFSWRHNKLSLYIAACWRYDNNVWWNLTMQPHRY